LEKIMNTKLLISATAAAAFAVNVHAAGVVTAGDLNTIDKGYGRADGLTHALTQADRVTGLSVGKRRVGVAYDADVAARTNMPRAQTPTSELHARSYDPIDKWYGRAGGLTTADVAARTDTPRDQDAVGLSD
jgi:hypothetical protein